MRVYADPVREEEPNQDGAAPRNLRGNGTLSLLAANRASGSQYTLRDFCHITDSTPRTADELRDASESIVF